MTTQTTRAALSRQPDSVIDFEEGWLRWQLPLAQTSRLTQSPPTTPTPTTDERRRSGHIGLIVLGSIVAGLVLGLVLVLGLFGGNEEATITGAALISLGAGMLILFLLAGRRTDQPQPWALAPAIILGALGFATADHQAR